MGIFEKYPTVIFLIFFSLKWDWRPLFEAGGGGGRVGSLGPCGASRMRGDVQDFSLRGSHMLSPSCCQNQQHWEVLGGRKRKSQLRKSCVQNSKLQSLPERAEKDGRFHHYRHGNRLGPYSAIFSGSCSLYQPPRHYPLPSAYFLLALEDLKRTQHSLSLLRVNHQEIWRPSAEMMFCISKFRLNQWQQPGALLGSSNHLTPSPLKSFPLHWQPPCKLPSVVQEVPLHLLTIHSGPLSTFKKAREQVPRND